MSTDLFALLRARRGWVDGYLERVNDPSHQPLKDLDLIVDQLQRIRMSGELLVVLPDFDMDGISSGVTGYAGLAELGFNVGLYRPDPQRGHGFSRVDIDAIVAQYPNVSAIISCDVGIDSFQGAHRAVELGITMMVTDHHKEIPREGSDKYAKAHIIIDPMRLDETYEHPSICGAFVLYQVLEAYTKRYQPHKTNDIALLKLFAGIGTVSDVMPLLYENRQIVRDSVSIARLLYAPAPKDDGEEPDIEATTLMQVLRSSPHHPTFVAAFEGMARIMAAFIGIGKLRTIMDLTEEFYAFYLAPAFNSIRRVGGSIDHGFGAFFAPDKDDRIAAVIEMGEERKRLVDQFWNEELVGTNQPYAPYIFITRAPSGMLGLLANKMMQLTGLPTCVLHVPDNDAEGFNGSCRSPGWYPYNSTLNAQGFHAAGHEQAFGVHVGGIERVEALYDFVRDNIPATYEALAQAGLLVAPHPDLRLGFTSDCDAPLDDIEALLELTEQIAALAPFGHEFPWPDIELVIDLNTCKIDRIGSEAQHVRLTLRNGLKCLWWNQVDALFEPEDPDTQDIDTPRMLRSELMAAPLVRFRGKFAINVFRGMTSVNFIIDEMVVPE